MRNLVSGAVLSALFLFVAVDSNAAIRASMLDVHPDGNSTINVNDPPPFVAIQLLFKELTAQALQAPKYDLVDPLRTSFSLNPGQGIHAKKGTQLRDWSDAQAKKYGISENHRKKYGPMNSLGLNLNLDTGKGLDWVTLAGEVAFKKTPWTDRVPNYQGKKSFLFRFDFNAKVRKGPTDKPRLVFGGFLGLKMKTSSLAFLTHGANKAYQAMKEAGQFVDPNTNEGKHFKKILGILDQLRNVEPVANKEQNLTKAAKLVESLVQASLNAAVAADEDIAETKKEVDKRRKEIAKLKSQGAPVELIRKKEAELHALIQESEEFLMYSLIEAIKVYPIFNSGSGKKQLVGFRLSPWPPGAKGAEAKADFNKLLDFWEHDETNGEDAFSIQLASLVVQRNEVQIDIAASGIEPKTLNGFYAGLVRPSFQQFLGDLKQATEGNAEKKADLKEGIVEAVDWIQEFVFDEWFK